MRHSVVTLRGTRFVPARSEFGWICDSNPCAALLLAVFDFHTAARQNDAEHREAHGLDPHPMGSWIRASVPWLERELGGLFRERAIRSALDLLVERHYLDRQANPEKKLDRALWYRLDVHRVNSDVAQVPITAIAGMEAANAVIDASMRRDHARTRSEGEPEGEPTPSSRSEIEEVWDHYVAVFDAKRQTLDSNRTTIIRNALKVRTVAECKRAIDGLHVSPFHNGKNDGEKKYLGIQYALKGRRGESHDERIDSMIEIADAHQPVMNGKLPSDHYKIQRWLREVRFTVSTQGEKQRGRTAFDKLVEHGYKPKRLDKAPWVVLET